MSHPWVIIPAREHKKVEVVGSNVQTLLLSTFATGISFRFDFRNKSTRRHGRKLITKKKNKRQDVNFHFVNSLTFCQNTKDGDLVGICTDSGGGCKVVGHKGVRPVSPPFAVLVDVWPKCGQFDSGQNKSGLRLSPPMSEDRQNSK